MMTEEMTKTVFGEVLAEMLEARDMPATLAYVEELVEGDNTDAATLTRRIEGTSAEHPGDATMAALSDRLKLTGQERRKLAFAYTYEIRPPETPEVPDLSSEQDRVLLSALRRSDAINTAIATVEDSPSPNPRVQEDTLDELRMLSEEARSRVMGLKRQYGFKDY